MKTATMYEVRRSVQREMMPKPEWNTWDAYPKCRTGCALFVDGKCAWHKSDTAAGQPCLPCITKSLKSLP